MTDQPAPKKVTKTRTPRATAAPRSAPKRPTPLKGTIEGFPKLPGGQKKMAQDIYALYMQHKSLDKVREVLAARDIVLTHEQAFVLYDEGRRLKLVRKGGMGREV